MTNKERLISLIGFAPAPNSAEGALLDQGLDPALDYDSSDINTVKKAAIEVMTALITTADTGNGEVGFQIKYDRPSILKLIEQFKEDVGVTVSNRTITGIQPW